MGRARDARGRKGHCALGGVRPAAFRSEVGTSEQPLPRSGTLFDERHARQATISSDNYLRIYECLEQPSLSTWQLLDEVDVLTLPTATPSSRSIAHTVTVATPTQTSAPLDGNSVSLVSSALQQQAQQSQVPGRPGLGTREVGSTAGLSPAVAHVFVGGRRMEPILV